MDPSLTVLMAVRNGAQYLPLSIGSILAQTYPAFRFLIVDDCSTDASPRIVESYGDPRIELVRLTKNIGQTAALNLGLRRISTPWIARMDADDFSAPRRLEEQVKALERFPDVHCIGTAVWEFRSNPAIIDNVVRRPEAHEQIRRAALLGQGIIHGSILIQREALRAAGGYEERYRYAADRELFIRFLRKYRAVNLPDPLLALRRHPGQDSYSLRAADEYIDIFQRLLAGDGYSGMEREILRDGLAYSYIFRADWFRSHRQYGKCLKDLLRSFRTRPSRAVRTLGGRVVRGAART